MRAADLEPLAGRGAHVRAGAPFNARCVIARCVIARCVIALRALFTARCVILLRRTGSALPLRTRRAPSGLRSSRRALHADTLFFCSIIQYISILISIRRSIIYQVIQVGTQKEGCEDEH